MNLKFVAELEGPIRTDEILYLKCPMCSATSQYSGPPDNPVLTSVICGDCGFIGMGCSFTKAIAKKRALSTKEKKEIIDNYVPPEEIGNYPYNPDDPNSRQFEIAWALIRILARERPMTVMLKGLSEQPESTITTEKLLDFISSLGYGAALMKKASYLGLIEISKVKRLNISRRVEPHCVLTKKGKEVLELAIHMGYDRILSSRN
jgi:hypothetical protein